MKLTILLVGEDGQVNLLPTPKEYESVDAFIKSFVKGDCDWAHTYYVLEQKSDGRLEVIHQRGNLK